MRRRGVHTAGSGPPDAAGSRVNPSPSDAHTVERRRDHLVVRRRVRERAPRQIEPQRETRTRRLRQRRDHPVVVLRLDDDQHIVKVLRRRAQQARPADVDLLDELVERQVGLRRRLRERIQVDDDEIDRRDAVLGERRAVVGAVPARQNPGVDPGMERLDPAVHHLGHPGDVRDADYRQAGPRQGLGGPAGGDQFDAPGGQGRGKWHQPCLIGDTQKRAHEMTVFLR